GGIAVHCAAGRDRTGLVVALLLSLAGVPDDLIAADYALSEERLRVPLGRHLATLDPVARDRIAELSRTEPDTMVAVLEHVRSRYGGVGPYLADAGCGWNHQFLVRRRLLNAPEL